MGTTRSTDRENYERTRRDFDDMSLEDQATFWVEVTASLVARGVREAGEVVAREVDCFFEGARRKGPKSSEASSGGPGPAEPETGQQRAPRSGGSASEDD